MHVILEISGEATFHLCSNKPNDLVPIPPTSDDYKRIHTLFTTSWAHPDRPKPSIKSIFYVAHSSPEALAHLARFSDYSNKVGNTQLLFHGTPRTCTAGHPSPSSSTSTSNTSSAHLNLCTRPDCSLCLILKNSYDIEKCAARAMFGRGIYSSSVSSKADIYASKLSRRHPRTSSTKPLKSIILNHVVLGRSTLLKAADHSLGHAPEIYNSVTGATTTQGGTLAYHEAIVYREDAICASAVVFYES